MAKKSLTEIVNTANKRINNINLREYNKELRRLKRAVARIEKRGYTFNKLPFKELKRPLPKSIERIKNIKAKDLYKYATYETPTGTIKGTERRQQERKEAALKARETRERNKQRRLQEEAERVSRETLEQQQKQQQQQFEEQIRKRDEEARKRLEQDKVYRDQFKQGKIIYEQLMDSIYNISIKHERSAEVLKRVLDNEMDLYGEDAVLMSLANAPSKTLEEITNAVLNYDPEDGRHQQAILDLEQLITGTIPTMERAKELQDIIDSDEYVNGY